MIERSLTYQLRATVALEFQRTGVRCTIELPLGERAALVRARDGSGEPERDQGA